MADPVDDTPGHGLSHEPSHGLCPRQPRRSVASEKAVLPTEAEDAAIMHPTSYWDTLAHLVKGSVGSGMFAMGDAFRNVGLLAGPIFTLFVGTVCVYAQHQLITTSRVVSRRLGLKRPPDYAETAELAFQMGPGLFPRAAAGARRMVNVFLVTTQLGICSVYFVFVATNIKQVLDQYVAPIDTHAYMAMALVPILAMSLVRNLKYLAPISLASNVIMCIGIAVTLFECAKDGLPQLAERRLLADLQRWPLFFGTVVYSFESICIVMPLMNEMREPRDFRRPLGVMNVGSAFVGVLLVLVGGVGYAAYGEAVKGSLTLNLDQTSIVAQVLRVALCVGILGTYPIQAYVPVEVLRPSVLRLVRGLGCHAGTSAVDLGLRIAVVLFTFLLAEAVPRLGLFISLVGALSSSSLAFLFPPLLDWAWRGAPSRGPEEPGPSVLRHIANALILLLGALITAWGTYSSLTNLIEALASGLSDGPG